MRTAEEKPFVDLVISFVGLVYLVLGAILIVLMTLLGDINYRMLSIIGPWMVRLPWQLTSLWQLLVIPLLVISIALSLIGLYIMNRSNLWKVRTGSALVLVASVIAFPTCSAYYLDRSSCS